MVYAQKIKKAKEKKTYEVKEKAEYWVFPFNERGNIENEKNTNLFKLHEKAISNPKSLTQKEKDDIYARIKNSSYGNGTGVAHGGVMFKFTPILNRYYVERTYGDVSIVYAPNKMSIRNNMHDKGSIKRINESPM